MDIKILKSYNKREKSEEDLTPEAVAYKFRLLRPLGKLHNIIVYSRSNAALIAEFKELAERLVPLDNHTR